MEKFLSFNIFVLVLVSLFYSSSAIKCYNCVSKNNPKCLDPKDSSLQGDNLELTECTPDILKDIGKSIETLSTDLGSHLGIDIFNKDNQKPLMVCQKLETIVNKETIVTRSCTINAGDMTQICDTLKKRIGNDNNVDLVHCSTCDSDGCNSAQCFKSSIILISASTILFYLIKIFA